MAQTTRTLNPLPFEALEPRRFEDLIRQLAYDFRSWQSLEATGRTGSDDGFDARGWEAQPASGVVDVIEGDDESPEPPPSPESPRKWLIQCKRERRIGPAKMAQYVDDINPEEAKSLYGIVLAAACDLSKKSRDEFRERCRDFGIAEVHIWAKSEIEDMLFQPKNDGLLFAYFNISLRIRQRTMKTAIRSRMAMKRKVNRIFGGSNFRPILIRDPEEVRYPFMASDEARNNYNWRVVDYIGNYYTGIKVHCKTFHAYLDSDGIHWDVADVVDDGGWIRRDPWIDEQEADRRDQLRREILDFKGNLPDGTSARLEITAILSYDKIIDIDEIGDDMCRYPHIYFPFLNNSVDDDGMLYEIIGEAHRNNPGDPDSGFVEPRRLYDLKHENRVNIFPAKFRLR